MIFSLWGKFTCIHRYQFCCTVVHCRVCVCAIVYLLNHKIYGLYALIISLYLALLFMLD